MSKQELVQRHFNKVAGDNVGAMSPDSNSSLHMPVVGVAICRTTCGVLLVVVVVSQKHDHAWYMGSLRSYHVTAIATSQ